MDSEARRKTTSGKGRSRPGTPYACTNCRRSKVKCDEKRPVCARCQRRNFTCSGPILPLKWVDDYVTQGKAFGRAGVWGKRQGSPGGDPSLPETAEKSEQKWLETPSVFPWNYVHYDTLSVTRMYEREQLPRGRVLLPARDLKHLAYGEPFHPSGPRRGDAEATTVPRTLPVFPMLKDLRHETLFHYYINHICPRATSSNQSQSPFASVILPYCLSASLAVFKAIQALAACRWSQYDPSYTTTSLVLKSQVLRDLRKRLAQDRSFLLSKDPEVTVILMMICLYEIVDHCDRKWIVHLQGAKDIIQYRKRMLQRDRDTGDVPPQAQDAVSSFTELFFAFQDVMGRTACAKADLFGASYWREDDCVIHPWMGCSPALADEVAFSMQSALLNKRLGALVQTLADPEDHTLRAVGELKRLACVIYMHCALHSAGPTSSRIKTYVRRILKLVSELTAKQSSGNIIWPLFVAAVELDPLDDELCLDDRPPLGPETANVVPGRQLVLEALMTVGKFSLSGVSRARYVIQEVWQARDFDLGHPPDAQGSSPASLNDWERYVVPVSDALSLV
ncbi:fungal-specific transcription factor domain-containing protein [Aspergillus keveii]|uniref:Fungal-specific transcription factor domain-containing protein n=1 Tax=Aspergillus keveii TaxID=714993 RepID=A0ABR4FMT5_9EURO